MELTLHIPRDVDMALKIPDRQKESVLLKELAVTLYLQEILSFGKARQLAGMSKWEFHDELGKRKIDRHYTEDDFEEDFQYGRG